MLRYNISALTRIKSTARGSPPYSTGYSFCSNRTSVKIPHKCLVNPEIRVNARFISTSVATYSGHNKWSKIRHNKAIQDSKRSGMYIRLAKDIGIAVQTGGSANPEVNPALALAIKKAKAGGLPKVNLERALAKAASGGSETGGQSILYELMTADKVALLVQCVTDNPARSKQGLNKILKDRNVRFTPTSYLFSKKAIIRVLLPSTSFEAEMEKLMDAAIELGAEDIVNIDEEGEVEEGTPVPKEDPNQGVEVEVIAPPDLLNLIATTLSQPPHSYKLSESELQWRPNDPDVARADAEALSDEGKEDLAKLVNDLEEYSECVGVWSSID